MSLLQYYNAVLEKLEHPQKHKISRLVLTGRIEKINTDMYICKPTSGYNKTAYTLRRTQFGDFACNCQGFNKRGHCSHRAALTIVVGRQQNQKQMQGILL